MLLAAALLALAPTNEKADDAFDDVVRPFVAQHCARCHGEAEPQGDLALTTFATADAARAAPDTWELVRDVLAYGEMPPEGEPAPPAPEVEAVLAWLEGTLGSDDEGGPVDPGPAVLRRLNHTEYANTVRALFGVDYPVEERFPRDPIGFGFDNNADALAIPDLLFEKYLEAAHEIAQLAIRVDDSREPRTRRFDGERLAGEHHRGDAVVLPSHGAATAHATVPRDGDYLVRARAWAQQAGDEVARMELRVGETLVESFEVPNVAGSPGHFEARARLPEGESALHAAFVNDYYEPEDPDPANRDRNLYVGWIELVGPLDPPEPTAFQRALLERFGEELGDGRRDALLAHLARHVWRRPPSDTEVRRLARLTAGDELAGATLEEELQLALEALLASPNFLYRVELDPPPSRATPVRPLTDWELATRLSYFLWSAPPDEELYARCERGELQNDTVLGAEVERMLDDPRSRALADHFATQWLQVRGLAEATPDPERFPDFDAELRAAMHTETVLFFDALLRDRRSAWELVDGDWTFANERLARHYGLDGVEGSAMRRVSLADTPRRGVLGHGSVLLSTSDPTRTSPVKRGKWVLDALVGAPPPAPPPGADSIDDSPEARAAASLRERLELHRTDPNCAVCHARMDPLGFGLENYDGTGAWRDAEEGHAIDASGELPDGRRFDGPLGLSRLLRDDGRFARTLCEKLLAYALGRGLVRGDRRTVEWVLARAGGDEPVLRELVRAICMSDAFRTRRGDTR